MRRIIFKGIVSLWLAICLVAFTPLKAEKTKDLRQTTLCKVTFLENNEWGKIVAYYFDVESGRGKVFFHSGESLPKGTAINFEATVDKSYIIDHWTKDGKKAKGRSKTRIDFYLEKDVEIALVCHKSKQYQIKYQANPIEGGTLSVYYKKQVGYYDDEFEKIPVKNGESVGEKTKICIESFPKEGYIFNLYKINGKNYNETDHTNYLEITPTEDLTIDAFFASTETKPTYYKVNFAQPEGGKLQVFCAEKELTTGAEVKKGSELSLKILPKEDFVVIGGEKRNVLLGDAGERAWKCDE